MERLDQIDPRLFIVLPEHMSQAHHVWNYALLVTQMSHMDSLTHNSNYPNNSTANHNHNHTHHNASADATQDASSHSNVSSLASSLNLLNYGYNSTNKCDGDDEVCEEDSFLKTLHETTLMKIFKIKKRNKASLYNLILPSLASKHSLRQHHGTNQNSTPSVVNSTHQHSRHVRKSNLFDFKSSLTAPWRALPSNNSGNTRGNAAFSEEDEETASTDSSSDSSLNLGGEYLPNQQQAASPGSFSSSSSQNENDTEKCVDPSHVIVQENADVDENEDEDETTLHTDPQMPSSTCIDNEVTMDAPIPITVITSTSNCSDPVLDERRLHLEMNKGYER